jgi:glyoxylase-like metal-dependent hydrolase (beta-lactamase superfamily II)
MSILWKKVVVGSFMSNSYIILDPETGQGIIVDPGAEGKRILKTTQEMGIKEILSVINTHGHIDHIGANHEVVLNNVDLLVHREDEMLLRDPALNLSLLLEEPYISPEPSRLVEEGETVSVGDHHFRILHLPGHTPGSIALFGEGLLIVGDTLFVDGVGRTDFPGGSYRELIDSIRNKILPLPEDTIVLPGHGDHGKLGYIKRVNPFLK